tara:strand:+ start:998 stop:1207 length:210 start_codon:yes stop_codon:yes gene_type:complete
MKVEIVTERFAGHVLSSKVREATNKEVKQIKSRKECCGPKYKKRLVIIIPGWLYDTIECAICGKGLGSA